MRLLLLSSLLLFTTPATAADTVVETSVKLKTPRKKPPRQGGPLDAVELKMWIPGDVKVLRGAIVNPFYVKAAGQKHWQAAARHWKFGVIGANYFGVKNDDLDTLAAALKSFSEKTNRPEIARLPLCFVGMSAGGGMSVKFADAYPGRTIAAAPVCLEVGPRSPETRTIPIVTIFGERDGKQMEKLLAKLPEQRRQGALWSIAVQWRKRHEFARANNLVFPWFDRAIALRYPKDATPLAGPVSLQPIAESSGWSASVEDWGEAFSELTERSEEPPEPKTCWFPDRHVGAVWISFVAKEPKVRIASPAGLGDGKPFRTYAAGERIEVTLKFRDIEPFRIRLFNGTDELARMPADEALSVEISRPGIHTLIAVAETADGKKHLSPPNTIVVVAPDGAGR